MQPELNVSFYKRELLDFKMKIKLNGKRLHPTDSVRYLGVKIGSKLNGKRYANATGTKLKRGNAMLHSIYFA